MCEECGSGSRRFKVEAAKRIVILIETYFGLGKRNTTTIVISDILGIRKCKKAVAQTENKGSIALFRLPLFRHHGWDEVQEWGGVGSGSAPPNNYGNNTIVFWGSTIIPLYYHGRKYCSHFAMVYFYHGIIAVGKPPKMLRYYLPW